MTFRELLLSLIEDYGNARELPMYVVIDGVRHEVTGTTYCYTIANGDYGVITYGKEGQ